MNQYNNKKILLVSNNARSMLLFRLQFIKKLLSLNFTVVICAPKEQDSFVRLEELGVETVDVQMSRRGMNVFQEIKIITQLRKILSKHKPLACMFYTVKPVIYGSLACRGLGINNIYSMIPGLGYVFVQRSFLCSILRFFIRVAYFLALKNNEKVFFLNRDDVDYFVQNKIISAAKVCLIDGEGVDLKYYTYTVPVFINDQIVFLFIGRLLIDKGIREYISAARILKSRYSNVVFKVVGVIDENPTSIKENELQSWIDKGIISYCGYLPDVRSILQESSIFVLPSYREGMPVAILEAMASGRPIITTNAPGCRDTVDNGVNGYLVPIKDVNALVQAMEKFILCQKLIDKMGLASRKIAEIRFDVDRIVENIITNMQLNYLAKK